MLGLSWTELLVLGIVALIVIGPKELPALMNKMGKVVGTIRRMGADFQREINRSANLDQVRDIRSTIANPLKATAESIRKEFNTIGTDGSVKPSGAIKPADPKAESVVNEIKQTVGMAPVMAAARPLPKREPPPEPSADGPPGTDVVSPAVPVAPSARVEAGSVEPEAATPKINAVPAPPPAAPVKAARPVPAPAKAGASQSKAGASEKTTGKKPAAKAKSSVADSAAAPARRSRSRATSADVADAAPATPRRSRVAKADPAPVAAAEPAAAEPSAPRPRRTRTVSPKAE